MHSTTPATHSLDYSRNYSRPPFRPPLRLAQLHQDRCATRRRDAGARPRTGGMGHLGGEPPLR